MPDTVRPHRRQPTRLPIPGILQARTLEWVAISFSNAWKWKVKVKSLSLVGLLATHGLQPTRLLCPWGFPGKSTGVGCHCLLWREKWDPNNLNLHEEPEKYISKFLWNTYFYISLVEDSLNQLEPTSIIMLWLKFELDMAWKIKNLKILFPFPRILLE